MDVPTPISIQEARDIIREHIRPGRVEVVEVVDALGRILAQDLTSDIDVTPFDDSAMDGFAVISTDLEGAGEQAVPLLCVDHIGAGAYHGAPLLPGQCVRIMTGAPVPEGADAVVKIEDVEFQGQGSTGDTIIFKDAVKAGANIRKAGEEAHAGDVVMQAGEMVLPAGAGLLASTGNSMVPVYAHPKVAVITIGSELVDASQVPGKGMIRDSNRCSISAYIKDAGGIPVLYPRLPDDADAIKDAFRKAVAECDVVVSTGGACMGDFDLTPAILNEMGQTYFTRISMRPGKSQPFGEIEGKPVFVLSGNPGASSVGFEMFVRPALLLWQGFTDVDRPRIQAQIDSDVKKKEPRVYLQRGILYRDDEGILKVSQYSNQSSGLYGSLQRSDCLIVIPEGLEGKKAGDQVECILTGVVEGQVL